MANKAQPYPYDQPVWRSAHKAVSPDGGSVAEIARAVEHSMGNPTLGTLRLSSGLTLERCSPSFLWSADSRYLAVAQLDRVFGLFFAVRLLIVDTQDRSVLASRRFRTWLQPESFTDGLLQVTADLTSQPRELRWRIPAELGSFRRLPLRW